LSRQAFVGTDVTDFPPASHTAVGNTVTRTNLWVPSLWTSVPAFDPRPGKVYHLRCGGIIQTTGTPTIIFNFTWGVSATPGSNIALGASATVTLGTIPASSPWTGEFILGFRQIGVAAAGATATGNGVVRVSGAATAQSQSICCGGSIPTTIDQTIAGGMCLDVTWGTANASNTITAQWTLLQSLN
jgi:hypothetical protein